jgi:YVTN family beta-propeller protein
MSNEILLLVEKCNHAFSFYNLENGQRETSIALPDYPHEFAVDSQQRFAYVGHYGVENSGITGLGGNRIFQIDLRHRNLVREIDLGHYNRIHGIQMDQHDRLYVLSEEKSTLLVLPNPRTDTAPSRAVSSGGLKSHLFALTRDGQTAYCMNLLSHTVAKVQPWEPLHSPLLCSPGLKPEGYALSADEKTLFVTNRMSNTLSAIDADTMQVRFSVASRQDPTRLYLYRDGKRLLVTNYGERSISIVDATTLEERTHVPTGGRAIALSFHPTRALAYVSLDDDRVGIFDLDTCMFVGYLHTQREPDVSKVVTL